VKEEESSDAEAELDQKSKGPEDKKGSDLEDLKENQKIQEEIEEAEKPKMLEYFSKDELIKKIEDLKTENEELTEKIGDLEKEVKEIHDEVKKWKDKYIHLQADFENAQKRWDKNRQHLKSQYTAAVLKNFLPLYDSFKKALENQPNDDKLKSFYNQFINILKFEGAEPMQTEITDRFNYDVHEAVTAIDKEDMEPNRIVDVIQEGWKFNKDVLRYAKVVISKKPKPPEPEPKPEEEKDKEEKEIKEDSKEEKAKKEKNKSKSVEKNTKKEEQEKEDSK
ncbi:MAG: nucleotide exchange factor GrpE, partial [Candidatus Lokiarchaeota archaeon]|nr:nucleotide exchange factor GrpE [Candidatus Lokiarchaeota archaeon]